MNLAQMCFKCNAYVLVRRVVTRPGFLILSFVVRFKECIWLLVSVNTTHTYNFYSNPNLFILLEGQSINWYLTIFKTSGLWYNKLSLCLQKYVVIVRTILLNNTKESNLNVQVQRTEIREFTAGTCICPSFKNWQPYIYVIIYLYMNSNICIYTIRWSVNSIS